MEINSKFESHLPRIKLRSMPESKIQKGFTLLEIMVVIAVIAVLAGIAVPSYSLYITKTKRAEMMIELQKIGRTIAEQKLIYKRYDKIPSTNVILAGGKYPTPSEHLYTVSITNLETGKWKLTAAPQAGSRMANDGTLTFDYKGIKCRGNVCSTGDDWKSSTGGNSNQTE